MPVPIKECSTCVFNQDGECHRFPPGPVTHQEACHHEYFGYPKVKPEGWCGEYKKA